MSRLLQQGYFVAKNRFIQKAIGWFRKQGYRILGMEIGHKTHLPAIYTTFPNQVSIGNNCILEKNIYFKYDGVWVDGKSIIIKDEVFIGQACEFNISLKIIINKQCNIASGCKFIDHDHGFSNPDLPIGDQPGLFGKIKIQYSF